jgi:hypothetical protein
VLGPIIVDFGELGNLPKLLASGKMTVELSNKNITFIKQLPKGLKPALAETCPVEIDCSALGSNPVQSYAGHKRRLGTAAPADRLPRARRQPRSIPRGTQAPTPRWPRPRSVPGRFVSAQRGRVARPARAERLR